MVSEAFSTHSLCTLGRDRRKLDVATAAVNQATRNFTVLFPFFLCCVQVAAVKSSGGARLGLIVLG